MLLKDHFYEEPDGVHFPDARKGDEQVYGVNFSQYLQENEGRFVRVSWELESGLVKKHSWVAEDVAYIILSTPRKGSFTVQCTVDAVHPSGAALTKVVPLIVSVY